MEKKKDFFDGFNELFNMAKKSAKQPNIIAVVLIAFLIIGLQLFFKELLVYVIAYTPSLSHLYKNVVDIFLLNDLIAYILGIILVLWRVKSCEERPVWTLGLPHQQFLIHYLKGFIAGIISLLPCYLLLSLLGEISIRLNINRLSDFQFYREFLLMLIFWIIQGASEEILIRGWMLPILGIKYNYTFAIIVSSLFFGTLHWGNPGVTPLDVLNLTLMGVFTALYSIFEGNIWGTCAFHSARNWVQANLFVLTSSAEKYLPKLFEVKMIGSGSIIESSLLSEGKFIILIILVALIGILLIKMGKTNSKLEVMY